MNSTKEFLTRFLVLWGLIAAPLAFIVSLFDHLGIAIPTLVFLPNLPFDLGVGSWLIDKGFKISALDSRTKNRSDR